jgi:predicted CXXCH cytochrome family protein
MRLATLATVLLLLLLLPLAARAAGKHDAVGCAGCHGKKDVMAGNTVYVDPVTKKPYSGSTAICFSCHQARDAGGKGLAPVWRHVSHPFGLETVNPKVARVPATFLVKGRFECMSCHDPHPSNPNYKYLRADVGPKGQSMDRFCALCHLTKAG